MFWYVSRRRLKYHLTVFFDFLSLQGSTLVDKPSKCIFKTTWKLMIENTQTDAKNNQFVFLCNGKMSEATKQQ